MSFLSKQQLIQSLEYEVRIVKHLYTKIPDGSLDYKPTEKQRTMLELLQYLSHAGSSSLKMLRAKDTSVFQEGAEKAKSLQFEDFPAAMDAELEQIKTLIDTFTDKELTEEVDPFHMNVVQPVNVWIIDLVLKLFPAYRMQLFLYIKSAGNEDINTMNLWMGIDSQPKES